MNLGPQPSQKIPSPVASPLLRHWLVRGKRDLDPWLAAMNGLALTFLCTALAGAGAGNSTLHPARPVPPVVEAPEMVDLEPALSEPAASTPAPAATDTPPIVEPAPSEEPLDIPPWREAPEIIEPVEVVAPDQATPPLPAPKPVVERRDPAPRPANSRATPPSAPPSSGTSPRPGTQAGSTRTGTPGAGTGGASGIGRGTTPQPPYPAFARRDRLQGTVVVGISVANGSISDVRIVRGSGSRALDDYAANHVRKRWKWPAGTTTTFTQPFRFVLQ